jgi:hypothetical protein
MEPLVVTLTYPVQADADTLVAWGEELEERDASVANIPGRGVEVTVWVEGFDLIKAPAVAADIAGPVVEAEPAAVEVVSAAEHARRADAPTLPRLVSAPEVGELLGGISRQRVHQLRSSDAFPEPLVSLRTGPIWDARAIERFARDWARKPGRPSKAAG